jgi:NADH dehydrogenase (ubiquinone) 1 alpha subcomplex subunit 9
MFDLGKTRFVFYSPRDRESVKEVIADADIVINLIGKHYETRQPYQTKTFPYIGYKTNFSYANNNIDIPVMLAELCKEMQVDNFIHVSTAGASPDHGSEWMRTKYEGEQAVKEIYPWVTIVRPTQMFGPEDRFLNWFANMAKKFGTIPLVDGGHALTQPVYVCDVAETISRICDAPELFEGKTVDCFGPEDFSYKELAEFVTDITEKKTRMLHVPKSLMLSAANILKWERFPLVTPSLTEIWAEDFLPSLTKEGYENQVGHNKILTMENFGVKATPIEKQAFNYLHRFREGGHFGRIEGYHGYDRPA